MFIMIQMIQTIITCSIYQFGFGRRLDQWTEGVWFVVLAFMNVFWLTVYLETWKRYCAELAYRWATLDQRHQFLLQPRLEFKVKYSLTIVYKIIF